MLSLILRFKKPTSQLWDWEGITGEQLEKELGTISPTVEFSRFFFKKLTIS